MAAAEHEVRAAALEALAAAVKERAAAAAPELSTPGGVTEPPPTPLHKLEVSPGGGDLLSALVRGRGAPTALTHTLSD